MRMLLEQEPDMIVCAEAANAQQAIDAARRHRPDVATVDISMESSDGLELIKNLKSICPDIITLVVSVHEESLYAERALKAGAMGYLTKDSANEKIVDAVREICAGHLYLSPQMSDRLLRRVAKTGNDFDSDPMAALSDRELEVYRLIGRGLGTREIAEKLHLSMKTIETYRENIKTKLRLKDSNEMVRHAIRSDLEQT
jgi:DNA-binding NarL/FixJ family response regulator